LTNSTPISKTYTGQKNRNLDGQENLNAKKQNYWLGGTITLTNRFSTLSEENIEEEAKQSTEPKPPPIFINRCKKYKTSELINEIAKDKYLVKPLYNDQVRVQPTESSVYTYTTIVKAMMNKNTEFHAYKSKQERRFRVVLKNIHPLTDLNDIKQSLTDKGHVVTNIWNVKQRVTNPYLCTL